MGLCFLLLLLSSFLSPYWVESPELALRLSRQKKIPLLVYIPAQKGEEWNKQFQAEILEHPDFTYVLEKEFVFFQEDIDRKSAFSEAIAISADVPSLVLVDVEDEVVIASLGNLPLEAGDFANHLLWIMDNYRTIKGSYQLLDLKPYRWKELYLSAKQIGCEYYRQKIIKKGLVSSDALFFQLELYREALETHSPYAVSLRKKIEQSDPKNLKKAHYLLAMLDYQMLIEKGVEGAAKPLISYLEEFGSTDLENLWRVQMVISEYFFASRKEKEALFWARSAFKVAPVPVRAEIAEGIFYLRGFQERSFPRQGYKKPRRVRR